MLTALGLTVTLVGFVACSSSAGSAADRAFASGTCGDLLAWRDQINGAAASTQTRLAKAAQTIDRRQLQADLVGQVANLTVRLSKELLALAQATPNKTAARSLGTTVSNQMAGIADHIASIQQRWQVLPVGSAAEYDAAKAPLRQEFTSVTNISISPSSFLPATTPSAASLVAAIRHTASCKGIMT